MDHWQKERSKEVNKEQYLSLIALEVVLCRIRTFLKAYRVSIRAQAYAKQRAAHSG